MVADRNWQKRRIGIMKILEAKEMYLNYLENGYNRDAKTIYSYNNDIMEGINYLFNGENVDVKEMDNLTYIDVLEKWFLPRFNKGLRAATINRYKSSWKSFYNHLKGRRLIVFNPFSEIKKFNDLEKFEREILTDEELVQLIQSVQATYDNNKTFENCRNNLIVNILASTGMRVHELQKLNLDTINPLSGEFSIIGKGKRRRDICINDYTLKIYREYLMHRNQLQGKQGHEESLLLSRVYTRPTTMALRDIIKKVTTNANVPNITPHSFKHKFITSYVNDNADNIEQIGKFTGNKNIQVMYSHYLHQGSKSNTKALTELNPIYRNIQ